MEKDMKSIEVLINVGADTQNVSRMMVVFDSARPTEVFNGLAQATKDLERALKQAGVLTEHGIGTEEYGDYLEYMKEVVPAKEEELQDLYIVRGELDMIEAKHKDALIEMVQDKIDVLWKELDGYYNMFKEIQVVEVTEENIGDFTKEDTDEES